MKRLFSIAAVLCLTAGTLSAQTADYNTYLTGRGFTEVTSTTGITGNANDYYILTSAENTGLIVGIGAYEAKPDWASTESKALRYKSATTDPVLDLTNFFTIEKSGNYIGLRNVVYSADMFQTHDNAGYMYVNTYTDKNFDEWSYLIPSFQDGYWTFENGKYPMSSGNWACGYLGPWHDNVVADDALALNKRESAIGHYRLFRISKNQLMSMYTAAKRERLLTASSSNPIDATWLITNPSFETGDATGWTLNINPEQGADEVKACDYPLSNKEGGYLMNAYQWWSSNIGVTQTIDIPSGEYTLSGIVGTWENRTVYFTGNDVNVNTTGTGANNGIAVSLNVNVGMNSKLTISAGSTAQWWNSGHGDETQTFFKLDNVQLTCKGLYLNGAAKPLPNDETTLLESNQWYYYEVNYTTEYWLIGNISDMVYSTDGLKLLSNITTAAASREMTLSKGRVYFKTTRSDATLKVVAKREIIESTSSFKACALNVDGLPESILFVTLNEDGPQSAGTKKISTYLNNKAYDIMGFSEDFNFDTELKSNISGYTWGTHRGKITGLSNNTDGLQFACKNSSVTWANESYVAYTSTARTDGNQYVKKGYRHYDVTFDGQLIDVYITHMDAGDNSDAITSRGKQWKQLTEAINSSSSTRPKIVMGDTNCRWTRDGIKANFLDLLNSNFTASDVWVEFYRNGIYPTTDMGDLTDQSDPTNYTNYEIVDKIIYINPKAANTLQLVPQSFCIEQDYTYGTVNGTSDTTPLGDHKPVVVEFKYVKSGDIVPLTLDLANNATDNSEAIAKMNGATANVTLSERTLFKDNSWNTICLPFPLTIDGSELDGATLLELDLTGTYNGHQTGREGTVFYLFFKNANSIEAGKPYLIKWENGEDLVNQTFSNVVIGAAEPTSIAMTGGAFVGYYDAFSITPDDSDIYYLTADNTLTHTAKNRTLKACRAYFRIDEGIEDPEGTSVKQFVLNFGEGTTEVLDIAEGKPIDDMVYDLSGRRIVNRPLQRGIYVKNGRKIIQK